MILQVGQCLYLRNRIREMEATKESLQRQLGTPLLSQLSDEEKSMLDQLQVIYKGFALFTVDRKMTQSFSILHEN